MYEINEIDSELDENETKIFHFGKTLIILISFVIIMCLGIYRASSDGYNNIVL